MARAIDADALIKVFQHKSENNIFPLCLISTIEEAPTIDPVKHGKWIEKTWHSRGGYRYLKCECGKEHCIEKPIDDIVDICSECGKINEASFRNYCPNCGARMDGD